MKSTRKYTNNNGATTGLKLLPAVKHDHGKNLFVLSLPGRGNSYVEYVIRPAHRLSTPSRAPSSDAVPINDNGRDSNRDNINDDGANVYGDAVSDLTTKKSALDLVHTYTTPSLRGSGLASEVVRAAFEYAERNDLCVIPTCSYVPVFVERNPCFRRLIFLPSDRVGRTDKELPA